jgi:hypothetical protein
MQCQWIPFFFRISKINMFLRNAQVHLTEIITLKGLSINTFWKDKGETPTCQSGFNERIMMRFACYFFFMVFLGTNISCQTKPHSWIICRQ